MEISKNLAATMRAVMNQLRDVDSNTCSHGHCTVCEKMREEVMREAIRRFGWVIEKGGGEMIKELPRIPTTEPCPCGEILVLKLVQAEVAAETGNWWIDTLRVCSDCQTTIKKQTLWWGEES